MQIEISNNFKNWLIANTNKCFVLPKAYTWEKKEEVTVPEYQYQNNYLIYEDHKDIQILSKCYTIYDYKGDL